MLFRSCQICKKKIDVRHRSNLEIMHGILEAVRSRSEDSQGNGATKTRIMYGAFLSYAQLKEYLEVLTECGLLNSDQIRQTFKITEKGLRFLKIYSQMEDTIMIGNAEGRGKQQII
jgi:predicted transcriptional regulator